MDQRKEALIKLIVGSGFNLLCPDVCCSDCKYSNTIYCEEEKLADYLLAHIAAEPVQHGNWIVRSEKYVQLYAECSHCHTSVKYNEEYDTGVIDFGSIKYCPNCGAKMDEEVTT